MSTSSTSAISTTSGSPISVSGLASGLDTKSIVSALIEAERIPITRLTQQQEKLSDQAAAMQLIKSNLLKLSFAVAEFQVPSVYEGVQTVTSSEPGRVTATVTSGAGVGGYELEVTQLANSAQRTFTFTSPAAEDTVTVGGREYTLKAGASAKELATKLNADSKGTVYAAVVEGEKLVLSSRTTGVGGLEAITVSDTGGALTEAPGTAREGEDAEYKVDGVAGTSTSNVLTSAIAGVTLTLGSLTSAGPVTIAVQAPALNVKPIETQLQSFITLYNQTVEEIQTQLTTRPPEHPTTPEELATGTLFGDQDLTNLLNQMRITMYEPIAGLSEITSPADVGVSTGPAGNTTAADLSGLLQLDPTKLAASLQANPEAAKLMFRQWATNLNNVVNSVAEPGASLESRINGDTDQVRAMKERIATMNAMLALRQKALEETYARLESVISKNSATGAWLTEQAAQLTANSAG